MPNTENTIFAHTAANIVNGMLYNAMNTSRTLGIHWPNDAEFCVVKQYSTWPQGWSRMVHVSFFTNEDELKKELRSTAEFFLLEDNDYARRVYRWDLGPEEIASLGRNEHRIPTGYERPPSNLYDVSCGDLYEANCELNSVMELHRQKSWPKRMKGDAIKVYDSIMFESESLESIAAKLATLRK